MRLGILMILMICLGCGKRYYPMGGQNIEREVHLMYVDTRFNEVEREGIRLAIKDWEEALNGVIRLTVVDWDFDMEVEKIVRKGEGDWLILKLREEDEMSGDRRVLGFVNKVGGDTMWVVGERAKGRIREVIRHEIGHLLGVMHPEMELEDGCLGWETMEEIRKRGYGGMRYCD